MTEEQRKKIYLENTHLTYRELAVLMGYTNREGVKSFVRRNNLNKKAVQLEKAVANENLDERIRILIRNKKMTLYELSNALDCAPKMIETAIEKLRAEKRLVDEIDNGFQMAKEIKPIKDYLTIPNQPESEMVFGLIADTHLGSKYERLDVLNSLYDRFEEDGVKQVYHAGNWIDGEARFNKYDIYVHGVEAQVNNFIQNYPKRKGMTTYIISGDDHEGWAVQREHIDIGSYMQASAEKAGRFDLIDLGYMERDIELKQENGSAIMRIIHAGGGSSYALSYTAQKYVESLQGGEKPQIIVMGHYHKFDYNYSREVHVIQPGCTQDQTPFMRKKKLQAMVGGCKLWVKQLNSGIITSIKVEWMPYYDKKFYEYKWTK